ncbi:MAG: PAS domain-containing protein [Rhizobacter sp.]|nr:PAS domain-containing protein [Rhizobacter sp.]
MRTNLPVSQTEYLVTPGRNLVTTTDLKGRILHCNPAMVEASGFSREELQGQPHNIIRHPDMPEEAFRDLWATIAQGLPWSGLVKNRPKNGDFYWVQANVTPVMGDGKPVGYMSVRTCASRDAIAQAERLYHRLNDEHQRGVPASVRLVRGEAVRTGSAGRLQAFARQVLAQRHAAVHVTAGLLTYGLAAAAGGAWWGLVPAAALALGAHALGRHLERRPLHGLLQFAQRMAAGDLTQRCDVKGSGPVADLQASLNQLNVNLQSIVGDARGEAEQIEVAITEIASGNEDMSGRTESQAASLQQAAASMDQITGTVRANAESAQRAAGLAADAAQVTDVGLKTVERVSNTMHEISESSSRIAEISQVIDGISFQTNILALNAAVEAARVGEQGRGFAVVAGEVRALAHRTAEASKEIKVLIEAARTRIESGVTEFEAASRAMRESAQGVGRVSQFVHEISHASNEQLLGISQVNQAVSQLDGITQQNAAMVEELSASASALRQRAHVMTAAVQVFRTDERVMALPDAVQLRREGAAALA